MFNDLIKKLSELSDGEEVTFYDKQLQLFSHHPTLDSLLNSMFKGSCNCENDYDFIDPSDGANKCLSCYNADHLHEMPLSVKLDWLDWYEFEVRRYDGSKI